MMSIDKKDIFKTLIILWFVLATGYVIYDQYQEFKVRGMQAAYQAGYADSVSKLLSETEKSGCTPFEVYKDATKVQLVNATCLSQTEQVSPVSQKK